MFAIPNLLLASPRLEALHHTFGVVFFGYIVRTSLVCIMVIYQLYMSLLENKQRVGLRLFDEHILDNIFLN